MSSEPTVVFDLGGVLIDWNPRHLYRTIFADEAEIEDFLTHVCPMDWNERQDAGRPFAEAVAERVALFPEHRAAIEAYQTRWVEMLGGAFDDTVEILREQVDRAPVYALTNWSAETWPHAVARYPFLGWFAGIVVSGDEGCAKPDPRIFEILEERYSLEPATTVFIDDNRRNFEAARERGYDAIHFTDPAALRDALASRGLASPR